MPGQVNQPSIANASSIAASATLSGAAPTAGTMTETAVGFPVSVINKYSWTNAMVTALGASLTGDITVCTLPARTVVKRCWVVIASAAAGVTTLTVAVGRVAAGYIDWVVASDAKAAANSVYGDAIGEIGTGLASLPQGDMPSFTATTAVKAHFISTVANLDQVTNSTGVVYLETMILP